MAGYIIKVYHFLGGGEDKNFKQLKPMEKEIHLEINVIDRSTEVYL